MGQQINKAPMCPCNACWNAPIGSPSPHAKAPKAAPAKKTTSASSTSSLWKKQVLTGKLSRKSSVESMSSMKPLTQAIEPVRTNGSDTDSVYSFEKY